MTRTTAQITRDVRGCFVKFSHVLAAQARIRQLVQRDCQLDEPDILVFVGDPGVGKSRMLTRTVEEYPRIEHETFTEIPVAYVPVPTRCSPSALVGAILRAMGSPFWNKGREADRTHQLLTLLRACRVRVLVLDEVNHLVDRGRERSHYLLADWLKQLSDQSRVHMVLAGIPRLRVLFKTNEQLADRVAEEIVISPFGIDGKVDRQMRVALLAFARLLGPIRHIDFADARTCQAFVFATAGRLRGIRRLLVRSVEIAMREPEPRIDYAVLAQAFREVGFRGAPDDRNPFTDEFNGLPLIGPDEPYAPRRQPKEEVDV
jgi:hypothetical protein